MKVNWREKAGEGLEGPRLEQGHRELIWAVLGGAVVAFATSLGWIFKEESGRLMNLPRSGRTGTINSPGD